MEAAAKIVVEEYHLADFLLAGNNLKEYLNKRVKHWHASLHFLGINNMVYGALKKSVTNTWLTQQVNAFPKSYTKTAQLTD